MGQLSSEKKEAIEKAVKELEDVVKGDDWNLLDPNDSSIRDTVKARDLWQRILVTRFR